MNRRQRRKAARRARGTGRRSPAARPEPTGGPPVWLVRLAVGVLLAGAIVLAIVRALRVHH